MQALKPLYMYMYVLPYVTHTHSHTHTHTHTHSLTHTHSQYLSTECSQASLNEFREGLENRARVRVQLQEDLKKKRKPSKI